MSTPAASSAGKLKQTRLSSVVRRATCTRASVSAASPEQAARIRLPSWDCWSGAGKCAGRVLSYRGLEKDFVHQVVDHAVEYVNGRVHTNGLENFWSLLKRGINGTYVSIEPFHLFRYLDEQSFRFNNRKLTDERRFESAARGMVGKRLTFAELTSCENGLSTARSSASNSACRFHTAEGDV